MHRLFFAAVAAVASLAASAADWYDVTDNVLTFNVTSGTATYSDGIPATIVKIVKNGAGTVIIPGANTGFASGKTVEITAGVLEVQHKNSLGSGNTVKVTSGAQYKMNFTGTYGGTEGAANALEFAGTGPDGTGAIYLGVGSAAARCDGFLGNFKLTGNATIGQYASQWRGTSGTCDLGGYTLTVIGNNYFNFGNTGTVWKGGTLDLQVGTVLLGNPTFEGGAENNIFFSGPKWQFWSLTTPIPWSVTFKKETTLELGESLVSGAYSTNCNIFAGPFKFENNVTIHGYSGKLNPGRCMTFAGPVSGAGKILYLGAYNPQVYFAHANTFHGLSIAASAGAKAHALADGALPSIANETHYLSLHGNNADYGEAEIWLGDGLCTSPWVAKAIASMDTWNGIAGSAKLGLRTSGDFTFDADIPEPSTETEKDRISNVGISHVGTGTLTYAGAFPSASDRKVRIIQREANTTVLGAPDGETVVRQLAGLHVLSGTVEVARGARLYAPNTSAGNIRVGGYEDGLVNDTGLPAKLVVRTGGVIAADTPGTSLKVGARGSTPAILDIEDGALVTNNLRGADQAADRSAIRQFGGNVFNLAKSGYDGYLACRGRGFYGLFGGTFRSGSYLTLGGIPQNDDGTARGSGMFMQTGGVATFQGLDTDSAMVTRGGDGEYLMKGGTLTGSGTFYLAGQQYNKADVPNATAVFSMHGDGNPVVAFDGTQFYLTRRESGVSAMLNLNAGTFSTKKLYSYWCTAAKADVTSVVNFNGGTYKLRADDAAYVTYTDWRPYRIVVYGKGATFDVAEGKNYWLSSLEGGKDEQLHFDGATGKGLKSVRIPANMPREGYAGIVPCKVIGGAKDSRASVALDFDPATGTIAEELLITCPGCDYAEVPRIIAYGPDFTTEYECVVELTDENQELNPGKVYKTGPGQFAINVVNNTFAGTYVISNGVLKIPANNSISEKASVFVAGGKFWYDWKDRTIKSIGGYGGFYGYKGNNNTHRLTVTDSLDFDAADLLEGRTLEMESDIGDTQTVNRDYLSLGNDCVVRIAHPELLPEGPASYTLLRVNVPLNRTPVLADADKVGDGRWKIKSTNGGKTLKLFHSTGYCIYLK